MKSRGLDQSLNMQTYSVETDLHLSIHNYIMPCSKNLDIFGISLKDKSLGLPENENKIFLEKATSNEKSRYI